MKILITGGAGFIGSNLSRHALRNNHDVRVLDDFSTGYKENVANIDVQVIEGSLLDLNSVEKAVNGVDAIIHLGALGSVPRSIENPTRTHNVNATGTLNILEAARKFGVKHVSCASSSSVYGMNPALPKNEREWVRPMSPYAVSKLATEQYTLSYQQSFGLKTLAFRFFNVYGPRQMPGHAYAAVIPVFMESLIKNNPLPINGDGSNSRDFTFVGTVCDVLLKAAEQGITNLEPVNLAFGTNTNLLELVDKIQDVAQKQAIIEYRDPRPGDVPHSQADNTVLRSLFPGVVPTGLDQGLKETYEWMEANTK